MERPWPETDFTSSYCCSLECVEVSLLPLYTLSLFVPPVTFWAPACYCHLLQISFRHEPPSPAFFQFNTVCRCTVSSLSVCSQQSVGVQSAVCRCTVSSLSVYCQQSVGVQSAVCRCSFSSLSVCSQQSATNINYRKTISTKRTCQPWHTHL